MTVKQQKALAAMIDCTTMKEAAKAAGVGVSTLRGYLREGEFKAAYKEALDEIVAEAVGLAKRRISPAFDVLWEVASNREEPAGCRVSAARSILEFTLRLSEYADITQRLTALEARIEEGGKQ